MSQPLACPWTLERTNRGVKAQDYMAEPCVPASSAGPL